MVLHGGGAMALILASSSLLLLLLSVDACFLQSCPYASKRSAADQTSGGAAAGACMRCGGDNDESGICYGPEICCLRDGGGCLMGKAADRCSLEQLSDRPCVPPGTRCSTSGAGKADGYCASERLCCSDVHCRISTECHVGKLG